MDVSGVQMNIHFKAMHNCPTPIKNGRKTLWGFYLKFLLYFEIRLVCVPSYQRYKTNLQQEKQSDVEKGGGEGWLFPGPPIPSLPV